MVGPPVMQTLKPALALFTLVVV